MYFTAVKMIILDLEICCRILSKMQENTSHTFGDDWMTTLLQQFSSYLDDPDQIRVEWPMLKNAVFEAFLSSSGSTSWSQVSRRFGEEYYYYYCLSSSDLVRWCCCHVSSGVIPTPRTHMVGCFVLLLLIWLD